jgi:hypothetical protein
MHQAPQIRFPGPDLEVEIMLPIPLRGRSGLHPFPGCRRRRLRTGRSICDSEQVAQHTGGQSRFDVPHIASQLTDSTAP